MVQHGVAAIVGPTDPSVAAHVQSMAEILKVPHIETRFEIKLLTRFEIKLLTRFEIKLLTRFGIK
jgi:hypothetical protein